jgi:hypothetical protein
MKPMTCFWMTLPTAAQFQSSGYRKNSAVRHGFCGEENKSILREVNLNGRTRLSLSS